MALRGLSGLAPMEIHALRILVVLDDVSIIDIEEPVESAHVVSQRDYLDVSREGPHKSYEPSGERHLHISYRQVRSDTDAAME